MGHCERPYLERWPVTAETGSRFVTFRQGSFIFRSKTDPSETRSKLPFSGHVRPFRACCALQLGVLAVAVWP